MKVEGNTTDKTHHIRQQKTLRYSGDPVTESPLPSSGSQMYCKHSLHKFNINPFSKDRSTYQSL